MLDLAILVLPSILVIYQSIKRALMAIFKKRVELPDLWVGIVGDMLGQDTETWVVEALFPDFKYTLKRNNPSLAVSEKNFDPRDFLTFKRALVMASTASLASWVSPMQFFRFDEVTRNPNLAKDFGEYFNVPEFTTGLLKALNTADMSFLPQTICAGSEVYGRRTTLPRDQAHMFETANISLSYLMGFFEKTAPPIYEAISVDPASSRDTIVDFFAYVLRYWNHVLKDYKPV